MPTGIGYNNKLPASLRIPVGSDEEISERRRVVKKMEAKQRSKEAPKTRNSGKEGTKGQRMKFAKKFYGELFRILPKGMEGRSMSNVNADRQYRQAKG